MNDTARRRNVILGAVGLLVVVVAGGLFLIFGGDAPEEATLEDAVAVAQQDQSGSDDVTTADDVDTTVPNEADPDEGTEASSPSDADADDTTSDDSSSTDTGDVPSAAGADGTWTVDTSVGEFSYEDATSTFVGFRIGEELATIGTTEAVGRTPAVSGSIEIEGTTLASALIEADFTQITTDTSRRDGAVQRALDTATFPTATFELAGPVDFGAVPTEGEAVSVNAAGSLTVHGVTQPVEFPLDAQVVGDLVVVVGQIEVVLEDFGVAVPSAASVLSADDFATVEVQLFFSR